MKVTVNEADKKIINCPYCDKPWAVYTPAEKPFPKLMRHKPDGRIVYFTEPKKGFQLKNAGIYENHIGWHHSWCMDNFEDFHGSLTLENE